MKKRFFFILMLGLTLKTYSQAPSGAVAVDMGLSVKWASMNVGATKPEGYGDYYFWGETQTRENYASNDYEITKYIIHPFGACKGSVRYPIDNKTTLEPSDDAAHVNWGSPWRMPTKDEWGELIHQCTWTWTTLNEVHGFKVTARNGNSIFLPAAGYYQYTWNESVDVVCQYWSSTLGDHSDFAWHLLGHEVYLLRSKCNRGINGQSVRPVCP